MLRKTPILLFLLLILAYNRSWSQTLDEELGFIYVKAEYLLETGRYDEAVNHYNQVINKDATYKDALVHRGMAKYALAAYKGAKNDAMQHIELLGISDKSAALLGRAFSQLGQNQAAINSLTAAIQINNSYPDYYLWRAQIYEIQNMRLSACNDYEAAVNKGSLEALAKSRSYCGNISSANTQPNPPSQVPTTKYPPQNIPVDSPNNDDLQKDEVLSDGTKEDTEEDQVPEYGGTNEMDENMPPEDNTVNRIDIDEELSIEIYGQSLGRRNIHEVPSILILADEKGKVAIDICVDKSGKVTKAEFNGRLSTIAKKSLVSLAIRKAQEFEFKTNQYDMQCGLMVFEIK